MIDHHAHRAAQTIAAAGPEPGPELRCHAVGNATEDIQLDVLFVLGGLGNATATATGAAATTDDAANATDVLATPAWAMCLSNGDL